MKVLSYLQCNKHDYTYHQFLKKVWSVIEPDTILNNIELFYGYQFSEDIITKLFDGFVPFRDEYKFREGFYYLMFGKKKYQIKHYGNAVIIPLPRTIDEFITDCQRFGIELDWNKELIGTEPKENKK